MAVTSRIEPLAQSLRVIIDEELSPVAQGRALAGFAREVLKESQEINRAALGRVPEHRQFVDGSEGRSLDSVKASSRITFEFEVIDDITTFVMETLKRSSPVDSGAYRDAHMVFADGRQVQPGESLDRPSELIFLNPLPYARKIEAGGMRMRVSGTDAVYARAMRIAQGRFGNLASFRLTYQSPILPYIPGGSNRAERKALKSQPARQSAMRMERATRVPAILVTLR